MSLQGHVALVVGGASGIGLITAKQLLKEGANVTVCDISAAGEQVVKELQAEFGAQRSLFVRADVRNEAQLEAAFSKAKSHFKKLDIVVNCAGLINDLDWDMEVDINLKGVIRGTVLAWKIMGKDEGGSGGAVVNIASICGLMSVPPVPIYAATKFGVIGLGRSCGDQYHVDRTGVRVMTVCPGQTDTPFFNEPKLLTPDFSEAFKKVHHKLPIQKPENVAQAVLHVIKNGSSGSVWVSEDDTPPYQLDFPEYKNMRLAQ